MDSSRIGEFVTLKEYQTGELLELDNSGVIITQKLSELLDLEAGDTFTVDCDGRYTLRVAAVADTGIVNHSRYRVRSVPAAGALLKAEDSDEKQLELL